MHAYLRNWALGINGGITSHQKHMALKEFVKLVKRRLYCLNLYNSIYIAVCYNILLAILKKFNKQKF